MYQGESYSLDPIKPYLPSLQQLFVKQPSSS